LAHRVQLRGLSLAAFMHASYLSMVSDRAPSDRGKSSKADQNLVTKIGESVSLYNMPRDQGWNQIVRHRILSCETIIMNMLLGECRDRYEEDLWCRLF